MNDHIVEYLDYYINLENPQYAVLLIGNWGCGKTYFIKEIIKGWQEPEEFDEMITLRPIYISLNGVSDIQIVNERIRAEISPFLYSKGMKVAKTIIKGLLKTTAKIDFNINGDDKADGNLSFNIDYLGIFDSSNKEIRGKRILIFDDIERCRIKTDLIFGYINNFVEHSSCKVILLTDEHKIQAKYESDRNEMGVDYKDFKEKLVGQTFEIKSDIEDAVNHFLMESKKINEGLDLSQYRNLIVEIFASSELENLRVLKQSLFDFNRFTTFIDVKYTTHRNYDEFLKCILAYFIIISIEFRTGNLKIKEWQHISSLIKKVDSGANSAEGKYSFILEKYRIKHSSYIFPLYRIADYIENGFISTVEINRYIDSNTFFRKDIEQDWEKLWQWRFIEDKSFHGLFDKVWKQFSKGEVSDVNVVFHMAGIFISLIEENIIDKRKVFIVAKSKQLIKKIFEANPKCDDFSLLDVSERFSYGREFLSFDSLEIGELKEYLNMQIKSARSSIYDSYTKEVFEEITEDSVVLLNSKLNENLPDGSGRYERTAVLKHVSGRKIGRKVKSFNAKAIMDFKWFLHSRYYPEERYSNVRLEKYHNDDIKCLVDLKMELSKNMKTRARIKNRMINELIDELDRIIKKIEECKF